MKAKRKAVHIFICAATLAICFIALHILHVWSSGIPVSTLKERMESDYIKNEEQLVSTRQIVSDRETPPENRRGPQQVAIAPTYHGYRVAQKQHTFP